MSFKSRRELPGRGGAPPQLGQLGLVLFLVSLSVLFVAACAAVLITHHQVGSWRPAGRSGLPWGTVASTCLLVLTSWLLQRSLAELRRNQHVRSLSSLRAVAVVAVTFLFVQALNARHLLYTESADAQVGLFLFSYDLLIGLHAAHVLGGFVPLAVIYSRVKTREYSSSRHAGFAFCVQYWHYLGAAWLLVLATLAWVA